MSKGPNGKTILVGQERVTLDSVGTGAVAVTFDDAFPQAPKVVVVEMLADDSGTYVANSVTSSGFTLNVATSRLKSQDADITWVAIEKS